MRLAGEKWRLPRDGWRQVGNGKVSTQLDRRIVRLTAAFFPRHLSRFSMSPSPYSVRALETSSDGDAFPSTARRGLALPAWPDILCAVLRCCVHGMYIVSYTACVLE